VRGLAATDAALMPAQATEKGLQVQVVGWQAGNIVTVQQFRTPGPPQSVPGSVQSCLSRAALEIGLELLQQEIHLVGHLLPGRPSRLWLSISRVA